MGAAVDFAGSDKSLAFAQAVQDGRVKPGQLLLMEAMGGGLTWGACVLRL